MEPRISIIPLGVSELDRSTRFYRDGLGVPVHEAGGPDIVFFALSNVMLALYPVDALAGDAGQRNRTASSSPKDMPLRLLTMWRLASKLIPSSTRPRPLGPTLFNRPAKHSGAATPGTSPILTAFSGRLQPAPAYPSNRVWVSGTRT